MFAHTISRRKPTTPSKTSTAVRTSPTVCSRRDNTVTPTAVFDCGYCSASRLAIPSRLDCACAKVTPGFSRATICNEWLS